MMPCACVLGARANVCFFILISNQLNNFHEIWYQSHATGEYFMVKNFSFF